MTPRREQSRAERIAERLEDKLALLRNPLLPTRDPPTKRKPITIEGEDE